MNNEEQHRGRSYGRILPSLITITVADGMVCFSLFLSIFFGLSGRGEGMLVFQPFLFVVITTTTPFFPFPPCWSFGIFLNAVNEAITCAWVTKGII